MPKYAWCYLIFSSCENGSKGEFLKGVTLCFVFPYIRYEAFLLEYHGYLITACYDQENQRHFRSDDVDTEFRAFAETDKNGALLYPVEGVCGLLPCHHMSPVES